MIPPHRYCQPQHIPCHHNQESSPFPMLPPIRPERIPQKFIMVPPTSLPAIPRPRTIPYTIHLPLLYSPGQVHDRMVCLRCISTWTSRIDPVIPHVTGANVDDGKKDRRRKEIVGRLGREMNDRRDECVSPLASSLSHACSNEVASVSP